MQPQKSLTRKIKISWYYPGAIKNETARLCSFTTKFHLTVLASTYHPCLNQLPSWGSQNSVFLILWFLLLLHASNFPPGNILWIHGLIFNHCHPYSFECLFPNSSCKSSFKLVPGSSWHFPVFKRIFRHTRDQIYPSRTVTWQK